MVAFSTADGPGFHAAIGHIAYDSIPFNGPPIADAISSPDNPLLVIEHLGLQNAGAGATSHTSLFDALLVNLSSQGSARGKVGGTWFDEELHRGQVSFVPQGLDFELEFPSSNGSLLIFLPDGMLRGVMDNMGVTSVAPIVMKSHERLRQLITLIDNEVRAPGFASDLMIDGIMRAICSILVRADHSSNPCPGDRVHMSRVKLNRVIEFVEARLDQQLSLDDLARIAELSPFHFSRVFKLTTGETPYHFDCSRRLARAQQLLTESDITLAELALGCGFASQSHFTAAFSKAFGTSPGRYRRARARS